jgi:Zn-dependent protease with chaperone function
MNRAATIARRIHQTSPQLLRKSALLRTSLYSLVLGPALLASGPTLAADMKFADAKEWAAQTRDRETQLMLEGLIDTHESLGTAFGLSTRLLISDSDDINAFAGYLKKERIVVMNIGLIVALKDDRDAIAAVLGHEIAHHGKNHVKGVPTKRRVLGILGVAAGALLDHATGGQAGNLAYDATGLAAKLLGSKFNRDQERQADSEGVARMVAAGYNPQGAVRMHQFLLANGGGKGGFLASHPGEATRIANIQKQIAASPAAQALASKERVALYDDSANEGGSGQDDVAALVAPGRMGVMETGRNPHAHKASPPAPECGVRRNGGCFDLVVDGQKALPLPTPRGTAVYHGVDYHTHTRSDQIWTIPEPVSERPAFAFQRNAGSVGWFGGDACLEVIVEVANPATYNAQRVAHFGCDISGSVRVEGQDAATARDALPPTAIAPGDYVVFVRAYGAAKGWDGKVLIMTVK